MEQTPRNFALQLGAIATLYASITALITLLFSLITIILPDAAESPWQITSASESIRFSFAALVIFFPAYIVLTRYVNVIRRTADDGAYLSLTRWLIYLSLCVGGAILLGDAVAVVYSFLNGELTLRFFLKAVVLATIIASAFTYYVFDAKGYWQSHERRSLYCGAAAIVVVIAALVFGFYYMEKPSEVRAQRIDQQQLNDLQDIQQRIENFLIREDTLPATIEEAYPTNEPPTASAERPAYRYERTAEGFELCAEFGATSESQRYSYPARPVTPPNEAATPYIENPNDWEHAAGNWCFERTVNQVNVDE